MGWVLALLPRAVAAAIDLKVGGDRKAMEGWDAEALAAGAEHEMSRED